MWLYVFLILFFKMSTANSPNHIDQWIIWNVGQGQWITKIGNDTCTHFDFGGEIFALSKIKNLYINKCRTKTNRLYLSHADWDHYSFYNFVIKNNIKTCWEFKPTEKLKKINTEIPFCENKNQKTQNSINILYYNQDTKRRNDNSTVIESNHFLIPGDSTSKQEKIWTKNILQNNAIKYLILGHHGSRTSTSESLLARLPDLKMAIATSRHNRYGHPHPVVIQRLRRYHLNVIRTESWGSILIL